MVSSHVLFCLSASSKPGAARAPVKPQSGQVGTIGHRRIHFGCSFLVKFLVIFFFVVFAVFFFGEFSGLPPVLTKMGDSGWQSHAKSSAASCMCFCMILSNVCFHWAFVFGSKLGSHSQWFQKKFNFGDPEAKTGGVAALFQESMDREATRSSFWGGGSDINRTLLGVMDSKWHQHEHQHEPSFFLIHFHHFVVVHDEVMEFPPSLGGLDFTEPWG